MSKFNFLRTSIVVASVVATQVFANPASNIIPSKEQQDAIMKATRASDKYSCTPEEVANYLERSTPSSGMQPAVPTFSTHLNNQIIEKQENGEESCFSAFGDNEIMKKLEELMELLDNMNPSASIPSTDAVMALMKELAKKMWEAAKEGVCGHLTQEAAEKLVNEIMNKKLGYDINDIKSFDEEAFAKGQAIEYMNSEGVDNRWLNQDQWKDIFSDEAKGHYDEMKGNMFD